VPGFWNGYRLGGFHLPGNGYATYRLTVAYTIYIDQNPAASAGLAGMTPATTVPRRFPERPWRLRPRTWASAQDNLQAIEDPELYQRFFVALSQSMFLAAQQM
jgi:hypothetical protein